MAHYDDCWEFKMEDASESMEEEYPSKLGTTCDRNKPIKEKEVVSSGFSWKQDKGDAPNKYQKTTRSGAKIDVYDVLDAYKVENPAIAHAIKKMLCAGQRGYKDYQQDIEEAIQSLKRAKDFPPIPF